MLCAVAVASDLDEHFGAFIELVILENISPHTSVAVDGRLPRQIMGGQPVHDFRSRQRRFRTVRRNCRISREKKQSRKHQAIFHFQNSKTNLPRYSRQEELKNSPNLTLARLFWTSRGLK